MVPGTGELSSARRSEFLPVCMHTKPWCSCYKMGYSSPELTVRALGTSNSEGHEEALCGDDSFNLLSRCQVCPTRSCDGHTDLGSSWLFVL